MPLASGPHFDIVLGPKSFAELVKVVLLRVPDPMNNPGASGVLPGLGCGEDV